MAADTFHEATWRRRVSVRIACEEVIQMKNRKITVPCDSSSGMRDGVCSLEIKHVYPPDIDWPKCHEQVIGAVIDGLTVAPPTH